MYVGRNDWYLHVTLKKQQKKKQKKRKKKI